MPGRSNWVYCKSDTGNTHAEECCLLKLQNVPSLDFSLVTMYTTMEPCSKRLSGKASCTSLIIDSGIKHVVIGIPEPDKFVKCEGVALLREAGVRVERIHEEHLVSACRKVNMHLLS